MIKPEKTDSEQDTIILLTDIYGPDYVNTQLVADEWSKAGFKVVVPDLFVGDPVPIEHIRVSTLIVFLPLCELD